MVKRFLFSGLIAMAAGSIQAADFVVGDLSYNILPSGTEVEVTERVDNPLFGTTDYPEEVTVPETVTYHDVTYNVVAIGEKAFYFSDTVVKINLPESIKTIGSDAFSNSNLLTSVNIPAGVTSIGDRAFSTCPKIKSLVLPEGLTELSEYLLYSCRGLKQLTLPSTLKTIKYAAMRYCRALTSLTLPEGVTTIEDYAFGSCSALESIQLPSGLEYIGEGAFTGCEELISIDFPESVKFFGQSLCYGCKKLESVSLPEGITTIPNHMFYECSSLSSFDIPASVTTIGKYAFEYAGLTSLMIPATVSTIEIQALDGLASLKTLVFEEGPTPLTIGKGYLGKAMFCDSPDVNTLVYGRNFICEVTPLTTFTKVKDLVIGKDVTDISGFKPAANPNIISIKVNALAPPQAGDFDEDVYADALLTVPASVKELYMSTAPWSNFKNMEGSEDLSSVIEINDEPNADTVWYDTSGRRVKNPANGIYIRIKGDKKDKIFLKD